MFDVRIPQNVDIAKAAEWSETPRTFEQKYGSMANTSKSSAKNSSLKVEVAPLYESQQNARSLVR
jgi:chromosome partitioning protein